MESKVLQKIQERDRERRAEEAVSKRERNDGDAELATAFLRKVSMEKLRIDDLITSQKAEGKLIASDIDSLEKEIASRSYLLLPFDLRQATETIQDLRRHLASSTASQQPQKTRFSFSRKYSTNVPNKKERKEDIKDESIHRDQINVSDDNSKVGGTCFSGLEKEKVFFEAHDEDVKLQDLKGCKVVLKGILGAVFLHNLIDCIVITGPVRGAAHVEGIERCKLYIAAHQVRIHSAQNSDFYLAVKSDPIIEYSTGLQFAPYPLSYEGINSDFKEAGLSSICDQEASGEWGRVKDFGWIRMTPSPNWRILPLENRKIFDWD